VVRNRACLIDIFDTVLTCDFSAHATELPALADVSPDLWATAFVELIPGLNDGSLSMGAAYRRIVEACGGSADDGLISRLVERDRELLVERAHVFDDVAPFLETLREWGIAAAFVSNCAESVRYLLERSGLASLVDCVVLSCEVKGVKPHRKISAVTISRPGIDRHEPTDSGPTVSSLSGVLSLL